MRVPRLALGCAAAAAAAAIVAPGALGAPASIKAGDPLAPNQDVFNPTVYSHDAGTVASLTWVAGGAHDADARAEGPDGKPLFRTGLIRGGTVPVPGTQYLGPGSYAFHCTIHAGMDATLNVAPGMPQRRPVVKLKLLSRRLAQVVRSGKAAVRARIIGGSGEQATIQLRLGKREIGKAKRTRKTRKVAIKLTKKGRALLARRGKAKLNARATIEFGKPAKATRKLN